MHVDGTWEFRQFHTECPLWQAATTSRRKAKIERRVRHLGVSILVIDSNSTIIVYCIFVVWLEPQNKNKTKRYWVSEILPKINGCVFFFIIHNSTVFDRFNVLVMLEQCYCLRSKCIFFLFFVCCITLLQCTYIHRQSRIKRLRRVPDWCETKFIRMVPMGWRKNIITNLHNNKQKHYNANYGMYLSIEQHECVFVWRRW